jgi:toxin ParE1/3/4
MKIQWHLSALADLANIRDYIAEANSEAARSVETRIRRAIDRLEQFPDSGRPGIVSGTRELVVSGLPYIVVYSRDEEAVTVIAVLHAAQDR